MTEISEKIKVLASNHEVVIICVGSEKVTGDMLGPLTGSILRDDYSVDAYIYGTLDHPVNGVNLEMFLGLIRNIHKNAAVIAVDAALGNASEIGNIKFKDSVIPGAAVSRSKPAGAPGIVGVVAALGGSPLASLMQAEYDNIVKMAGKIAATILNSINQVEIA